MTHEINGVLMSPAIIELIKYIQENKTIVLSILDNNIQLLLDQRKNIQESDTFILNQMEDLSFLKEILCDISGKSEYTANQ